MSIGLCRSDDQAHSTFLGELDGVSHQVQQDLPQPRGISTDGRRSSIAYFDVAGNVLLARAEAYQRLDFPDQIRQRKDDLLDTHLSSLNLAQIEDVVENCQEMLPVAANHLEMTRSILCCDSRCGEQIDMSENRRHWRANLVAHVGEEFALGAVGGFSAQARALTSSVTSCQSVPTQR